MYDILIIDDDVASLEMLAEKLKMEGYQVRPANDPNLALMSIQSKQPDLILTDVNMPSMTGYELFGKLQQNELTRNIPVIFISGALENRNQLGDTGTYSHIMKPIDYDKLYSLMKNLINAN